MKGKGKMIIYAKDNTKKYYSILIEKKLFDNVFKSYIVDGEKEILYFVNSHTIGNTATIIRNLKSRNYSIEIMKGNINKK